MSAITQPAGVPPTAPRRGGRRGGGGGGRGGKGAVNAAAAQPDDTEEVRKLRAKYADKLSLLREMFPDWTDEDLLFALQETGGEVEVTVGRISEGHAEQFSSVKSKKQVKKETGSTVTPSTFQGTVAPSTGIAGGNGSAARGGRGGTAGARGGRGGATAARGARGGRSGIRGFPTGRGGVALPVDGKQASDSTTFGTTNAKSSTPSGTTWADAVAATSSKSNGMGGGSWGDDTEGLDLKTASAPAPVSTTAEGTTSSDKTAVESTGKASTTPAEPAKEEPGMVASALAKILPSKLVPKGSKMSWAQVARPAEPVKPTISEPIPGSVTTTAALPANLPSAASAHQARKAETKAAANTASQEESNSAALPAAAVAAEIASPYNNTGSTTLPPGLDGSSAPTTTTAADANATTAQIPAATTKPSMGRSVQSQRTIQRAKQQEAVVMAGNNAQYDNLGVRFGSLNFLGGDDNDAQTEESVAAPPTTANNNSGTTTAPSQGQSALETSVATGQEPSTANAYGDRYSQTAQTVSAPTQVQQQTQTTPTHQDAFVQATSSPYNGNKTEALNAHQYSYQQGMAQHQQAHQAAVAQAQQAHQQLPQNSSSTPTDQQQYQQAGAASGAASTGYGGSLGGQQQQQQQPVNSQYGDYYANLDSQRLASFYGSYDQQSALASRGNDERSASQAAQPQPAASNEAHQQPHQHHQSHPSAAQQATPQQQQQFPNVMPYYYPHYYLPNQFQHYAQPGAGYGQYALYGQQPQHPSKPTTPATIQSPYAQNGPAEISGSGQYGNSAAAGQYGHSPAVSSLNAAGTGYGDGGLGRQGASASSNDYSKLYGNMATPASTTHSSSIPGLGGFLGQTPGAPINGNAGTPQTKNATSSSLENAYRQYDNGKVSPAAHQQSQQQQQPQAGQQAGQQPQQQRQQQQPGATPQQQQYYQQYNAYAAHQQPSAASGNYGNYPYRQYWG